MACRQVVGRILLVLIFLLSGIGKLADSKPNQDFLNARYEANFKFYAQLGVPLPPVALIKDFSQIIIFAMGGVMVLASILTIFSLKPGACVLIAQMTLITVIMHNPLLSANSQEAQLELIHALKNIAIIGGLMQVCCQSCGVKAEVTATEKPKKKVD